MRFNQGSGYSHYIGRDGISLDVHTGPGVAPIKHPFKITVKKSGESFNVQVRAGTVNNIVPKIDDEYLDAAVAPELTVSDDGTHRVYLKASTGDSVVFFPSVCEVVIFPNDQSDTDEDGHLLIGNIVIADGKLVSVNQYVFSSQIVARAKPGDATAIWLWSSR